MSPIPYTFFSLPIHPHKRPLKMTPLCCKKATMHAEFFAFQNSAHNAAPPLLKTKPEWKLMQGKLKGVKFCLKAKKQKKRQDLLVEVPLFFWKSAYWKVLLTLSTKWLFPKFPMVLFLIFFCIQHPQSLLSFIRPRLLYLPSGNLLQYGLNYMFFARRAWHLLLGQVAQAIVCVCPFPSVWVCG